MNKGYKELNYKFKNEQLVVNSTIMHFVKRNKNNHRWGGKGKKRKADQLLKERLYCLVKLGEFPKKLLVSNLYIFYTMYLYIFYTVFTTTILQSSACLFKRANLS